MKTLLVAINAKYIHTGLAVLSIASAVRKQGLSIDVSQFTINQPDALLLREIFQQKPDLLGISCYIWNIGMVRRILPALREILPDCIIALGGPEVSYGGAELFEALPCDVLLQGEGEQSFPTLMNAVLHHGDFNEIPSALVRGVSTARTVCTLPSNLGVDLNLLPFPYDDDTDLSNRIVYYETSRGCPFKCGYCLSGGNGSVRYRSLDIVFKEIDWFLSHGVPQVKLVDRTFNCDIDRALAIWEYLKEHDNGVTNFHFEIAAELLTQNQLDMLKTIRKGQFQFEIGIQSTNQDTLREIHRVTLPDKLTPIIHSLQEAQNIHLHLDLIAGLPNEGYQEFRRSYNYVYSLKPDQLQLGFLKLLKGSDLYRRRNKLGIVFNSEPPYEVLYTPCLPYSDLLRLKLVEEITERYYNSNRFTASLEYLTTMFDSSFDCYQAFGDFYADKGYLNRPHSKTEDYEILWEFFTTIPVCDKTREEKTERFRYLCLYDCCSYEKFRKLPAFLKSGFISIYKSLSDLLKCTKKRDALLPEYSEYDVSQLLRLIHAEVFPFDPRTPEAQNSKASIAESEITLLFNYRGKISIPLYISF